jgi:hypothetical protein
MQGRHMGAWSPGQIPGPNRRQPWMISTSQCWTPAFDEKSEHLEMPSINDMLRVQYTCRR